MKILHTMDTGGLYGKERMALALIKQQVDHGHTVHVVGFGKDDFFNQAARLAYTFQYNDWRDFMGYTNNYAVHDVIHTHDYKTGILVNLSLMRESKKVIRTVHGFTGLNHPWYSRIHLYEALDRFMLRFNTATVAPSRQLANTLKGTHIDNGIPPLDPWRHKELDPEIVEFCKEGFVLGCIARLSSEKNLENLIKAVASLQGRVKLIIFGDGPLRENLEEQSKDLKQVMLAGFRENVTDYLELFSAYIQPSWTEGMPMAVLEAMTLKVPLLLSYVGGMAELCDEDVAFVCPHDSTRMASEIARTMSLHDERMQKSFDAFKLYEARFSDEVMYRAYLNVYQNQ